MPSFDLSIVRNISCKAVQLSDIKVFSRLPIQKTNKLLKTSKKVQEIILLFGNIPNFTPLIKSRNIVKQGYLII